MLQREDLIGNEYFQRLGVPDQATFKTIQNILKKKSYCEILGVPPDASIASIKEAYRKLALVFHPDRYCSNQAKMDKGFNETDVKKLAEKYELYEENDIKDILTDVITKIKKMYKTIDDMIDEKIIYKKSK